MSAQGSISVDPAYNEGEVHFLLTAAKSSCFVARVIYMICMHSRRNTGHI
jgi:hypothetical protein